MIVRLSSRDDIPDLRKVIVDTDLFPADMLPDMIDGFLSDPGSSDLWLTCQEDGQVLGFCYAIPEELADGTWNMLAIAVLPRAQGRGCGGAIIRQLEAELKERRQRVLIAETSGTNEFGRASAFYRKNGYTEEARIRDFWAAGDDKIVFWKSLT